MAFHRKGRQITVLDPCSVYLEKVMSILEKEVEGRNGSLALGRWDCVLLGFGSTSSSDTSIKSIAPALYSKQLQHNTHF